MNTCTVPTNPYHPHTHAMYMSISYSAYTNWVQYINHLTMSPFSAPSPPLLSDTLFWSPEESFEKSSFRLLSVECCVCVCVCVWCVWGVVCVCVGGGGGVWRTVWCVWDVDRVRCVCGGGGLQHRHMYEMHVGSNTGIIIMYSERILPIQYTMHKHCVIVN